jgi:hypothetical protein
MVIINLRQVYKYVKNFQGGADMLATLSRGQLKPFLQPLYNGVSNLLLTLASGWDVWINLIN